MIKTTTPTPDMPTPPPTDAQVMKEFIAEADVYAKAGAGNDYFAGRAMGHAEARRELAEKLADNKAARAAYVKDAGDRIVKAAEKAGHAVADFLNAAYKKAEDRADQDRQ
jgi:hypothetical protein